MKKLFIYILIAGISYNSSFAQLAQASVAAENPRIIGSTFNFDVYFMRTDNNANWFESDSAMLGSSSWYFFFNFTDLTNASVSDLSPVLFPPGAGYTNVASITGPWLYVTTTKPATIAVLRNAVLNQWYKAFTVTVDITGTVTNESDLSWDSGNTGLTCSQSSWSVIETYFDSDCDIALNHKCWDGSVSGDWDNGNNWSPVGVPSGEDIIYPNNPANHLSGMAVSTYGDIQNLRINHLAEMPIPQYCGITVSGTTTLMGGQRNLILQCGTGVDAPSSAYIPEGGINYSGYIIEDGHIEVHRTLYYTSTSGTYYMHQVAAPVSGVILDDWDMVHFNTYAYEWDTGLQDWWNIYVPSRSTPPGYGFILSLYDLGSASTEDIVFYDNLMLTDVTPTFTLAANEYALLGNPFTAPIDWDVMNPQTNIYDEVHVWNPASGNYASYLEASGGNASAQYIQPGQSFFIRASGAATQFNIPTAARTQNIEPYLKKEITNLLRVYTEGGNETWDETYIRFKDGGVTPAFDPNHDGSEWPSGYGDAATEIYTVGSDGTKMSIDARPMIIDEQVSVPLSFKPTMEAEYKLHFDEESMNSFFPSIKIMLEDKMFPEQEWVDMRAEGYYTFDALPGDELDRFILHFWDTEFGIEDGEISQPIKIFSDRTDAIIVNDSEQLIKEILVYDIAGNLIDNKATVNNYSTRIYVSDEVGYYIVKVITDKAVYSEKVLITK